MFTDDEISMYISDMNFNQNGMELWFTCRNSNIIVMNTEHWAIKKSFSSEKWYVKSFTFLSQNFVQETIGKGLDGLCIGVSNNNTLVFLSDHSTDGFNAKLYLPQNSLSIKRIALSFDNELVTLILADGSFKLYSVRYLLQQVFQAPQSKCLSTNHLCVMDNLCMQLNEQLNAFDGKVQLHR